MKEDRMAKRWRQNTEKKKRIKKEKMDAFIKHQREMDKLRGEMGIYFNY